MKSGNAEETRGIYSLQSFSLRAKDGAVYVFVSVCVCAHVRVWMRFCLNKHDCKEEGGDDLAFSSSLSRQTFTFTVPAKYTAIRQG